MVIITMMIKIRMTVNRDDVIGFLLKRNKNSHIHFSVIKNDQHVSPEPYLTEDAKVSILNILHKTWPGAEISYY